MKRRRVEKEYTAEEVRSERELGLFWYSWLWQLIRPVLVGLCVLLVVTGLVMAGVNWVNRSFFAPVNAADTQTVPFTVEAGSSLTRVSNQLESKGLIRNRTVFKYYGDFLGYGQKIQAGEYQVSRAMSVPEIMELLTTGDGQPLTRNITIIPGWTIRDIADYLAAQGVIENTTEFLSLCDSGQSYNAYYYIADVLETGNVDERLFALEGYLAPDTYEIYSDAKADSIIKKLLSQTEAVFKEEYHERAAELGMTMDQVLTLASMIEKEAKTADFARVSAVFHNRLKQNMTLGSDVTIKYATGVRRMALTDADLRADTPYNTYTHRGLPPGPICAPSANAIQAALYPDEGFISGGYLYFCSKDPSTGELHFSKTLQEHELAVSIYAPRWQEFDRRNSL